LLFSKNSQLILRHYKKFKTKKVFFSGNIQDTSSLLISSISIKIHYQKYYHWMKLSQNKIKNQNINTYFFLSKKIIKNYDTLVYYWPKNKNEAIFQLMHLLSLFSIGTEIFIVGENTSGVKSASTILDKWMKLEIIEKARNSILSSGFLIKNTKFSLKSFFQTHSWKNVLVKSLPGVFGYKKIDEGSKLLASTFKKSVRGKVLDIGCGSGFLSAYLSYFSPNAFFTLLDNNFYALISSKHTMQTNNNKSKILMSDLYSNVSDKFDLIISNPPFHNDLKKDFSMIKKIISESIKYLKYKGELRFVINSCFNFENLLKKTFKKYTIIEKTNKYKVYQLFLT